MIPEGDFGRIVRALREAGPCHIDELARRGSARRAPQRPAGAT